MIRDYSESVLETMKKQIQDINDSDFCFITDGLGDLGYTFSSWIGVLDVQKYLDNISEYHKKVLDQHDTTVEKLDQIFEAVQEVDYNSQLEINELFHTISSYKDLIIQMAAVINPTMKSFNAANIQDSMQNTIQDVLKANENLNIVYKNMLKEKEKQVYLDSLVEIGKGVLSFFIDILSFMKNVASGQWHLVAVDVWNVLNQFFETANDLAAFIVCPIIGFSFSGVTGDLSYRYEMVYEADKINDIEGMATQAEYQGSSEQTVNVLKFIDIIADGVELLGKGKGIIDTVGEAEKILGSDILSGDTKWAYIISLVFKGSGYSNMDYSDATIIGKIKNELGFWKNLKNIYEWVEGYFESTTDEKLIGNYDFSSFIDKTYKWSEDMAELVAPWIVNPSDSDKVIDIMLNNSYVI